MERIWFRKSIDGLYWKPVSFHGWLVTSVWCGANVWKLLYVVTSSHATGDTLMNTAPFFIITTLIFLIIVRKTSGRNWE